MASHPLRVLAFLWLLACTRVVYSIGLVKEQHSREKSTDCARLTNNTVKACGATNSSATLATREEKINPFRICSPATCGGKACPKSKKRSFDNSTLDILLTRGLPEKGDWPDPKDDYHGKMSDFILTEMSKASKGSKFGKIVEPSTKREFTTSEYITFEDKVQTLGVTGLFGCTSIIVISRRGAWASHIWERAFDPEYEDAFREMAIQKVHKGDNTADHKFGIEQLMNKAGVGSRGVMFGDEKNPDDDPEVRAVILAPRDRPPRESPDKDRENPSFNLNGPPTYADRLEVIKKDLRQTLGRGLRVDVITYVPRMASYEEEHGIYEADGVIQDQVLDEIQKILREKLEDREFTSTRGKAIIQYRPGGECHKAGWRIFVEETGVKAEDEWEPSDGQVFSQEE